MHNNAVAFNETDANTNPDPMRPLEDHARKISSMTARDRRKTTKPAYPERFCCSGAILPTHDNRLRNGCRVTRHIFAVVPHSSCWSTPPGSEVASSTLRCRVTSVPWSRSFPALGKDRMCHIRTLHQAVRIVFLPLEAFQRCTEGFLCPITMVKATPCTVHRQTNTLSYITCKGRPDARAS
jgi:hypothetical protein